MSDPLKPVPSQIGSVTGVDRMDSIDRKKLDPRVKMELLAQETKNVYGRDPRSGGFVIVGRPRVVLQLLIDMKPGSLTNEIRLQRPVVVGVRDADLIGWWKDVPIVVRCTTKDDSLYCIRVDQLPESKQVDRQRASQMRVHAHAGLEALERLREV